MPAIDPPKIDDATALRVEEARTFSLQGLSARQQGIEITSAVLSVGAAVALAVLADADRPFSFPLAAMFVLAYAAISRVAFNVGAGYVVPTQLVFVPMLLLTPTPTVPLLVMLGTVLAKLGSVLRGQSAPQRMILVITDSTFALAPAAVLILLDAQLPDWASWPAYAAAVAAQFAADALRESLRAWLTKVIPVRIMLAEIAEACRLDLLLIPVGLLTALAAANAPAAALFVLPLVALLQMFARERDARIEQTLELGRSYRGTALLLCDLLEDDDEYTGNHTHDVVELSARVADRLRVPEDVKRETELGAMLHDIGKIGIPDAIINKPGPLDEEEWKLMKTHTLEGQRMLDRVGGFLGSVGEVVRASHERFDGAGYPDGLKGEAIPLASRIVSVCDAFNAMTTTRSYRQAMPVATAVQELRRCSGTQFDPAVVAALLDVVGDPGWALSLRAEPGVATIAAPTYSSAP